MAEVICLTGQMAAGKNYICSLLENEDCVSIDLDKTVHDTVELKKEDIVKAFEEEAENKGISLLASDGTIDRKALACLVFSSPELLKKQEDIVYPEVIKQTRQFIEENKAKTVLINAAVLYKTPELMELCSKIYFVKAGFFKRLFRAHRRDKAPFLRILKRFKAQKDMEAQYRAAGKPVVVIQN